MVTPGSVLEIEERREKHGRKWKCSTRKVLGYFTTRMQLSVPNRLGTRRVASA